MHDARSAEQTSRAQTAAWLSYHIVHYEGSNGISGTAASIQLPGNNVLSH